MTARWRVMREWDGLWHAVDPNCNVGATDECRFFEPGEWALAMRWADHHARRPA